MCFSWTGTIEVDGTEGASEEGGAQERLRRDDTIEFWEEDDTREGENGRFLELKRGAVIEENEISLAPQSRGAELPWLLKLKILTG